MTGLNARGVTKRSLKTRCACSSTFVSLDEKDKQHFHPICLFEAFKRARIEVNIIHSLEEIDGLTSMEVETQAEIAKLYADSKIKDKVFKDPVTVPRSQPNVTKQPSRTPLATPALRVAFTNADVFTQDKLRELKLRIVSLDADIIAISEVKPKNGAARRDEDYTIDGYTPHMCDLASSATRGIIVYTRSSLDGSIARIDPIVDMDEVTQLECTLTNGDKLLFSAVYRNGASTDANNKKLVKLLKPGRKYSHLCFVGDFNLPSIDWNTEQVSSTANPDHLLLEAMKSSYLHQHVHQHTRVRGSDTPSTLDLILTNEEGMVSDLQVQAPLGASDHALITFKFHCYVDEAKSKTVYKYDKGDYAAMISDLAETGWLEEVTASAPDLSVEELWAEIKCKLTQLRDVHVPTTEVGGNKAKFKGDFPLSREILSLIAEKKKAHRRWIQHTCREDAEIFRREYTRVRNKCTRAVRKAQRAYERDIALRSKKDNKAFWGLSRKRLKTKVGIAPLREDPKNASSLKFEDAAKARILQNQFESVFVCEPDGPLPPFESRTEASISNIQISSEAVLKELSALGPTKSPGPDGIHPRLLKELAPALSNVMAMLFQKSVNEGVLPNDWKEATVSPIFKKGANHTAANYRPVSLTSVLCKVLESLIRKAVMEHIMANNLLTDKQYGFISGRSTVLQLLHYVDYCAEIMARGGTVDAIYMDYAKAFDTVPHKRLVAKLEAYGIRGQLLQWIQQFLSNRTQRVNVNGKFSDPADVVSGVPQGSVLGPLLFVLFINDLPDIIESMPYLFADDTKACREIRNLEDSQKLQEDLDRMEQWSKDWLLSFHPDKCKVLTFGKFGNVPNAYPYQIGGQVLDRIDVEKDLGVLVDDKLSFEEHILTKVKKSQSMMGLIRRVFVHLCPLTFRPLYTAMVRSHLEYAQTVWSPHLKSLSDSIEAVQIRATKQVEGMSHLTYEERLVKLKLPTLIYRRRRGAMIEIWKHFNTYDKKAICARFQLAPRAELSRQHPLQLVAQNPLDGSRGAQTNSFYFLAVSAWNKLDRNVVMSKTINSFKNQLDTLWIEHMFNPDNPPPFNFSELSQEMGR